MAIITALRTSRGRGKRVTVSLNGRFAFSLEAEVAVKEKLEVGQELADGRIEALARSDQFQRCHDGAARYLSYRPRSEHEMRQRLLRRGFSGDTVEAVLKSIEAGDIPVIRVFNKIDLIGRQVSTQFNGEGELLRIDISAAQGSGLAELKEAIALRLKGRRICTWISLEGRYAKLRSRLFDLGAVAEEKISAEGQWLMRIELSQSDADQLSRIPGAEGALMRETILLAARQAET